MPSKKPPSDDLIALAAEARAGGASWDAVAAKVGRTADTVRRWPAVYPDRWRAAFQVAEQQLLIEATAEAVHTLRRQLRSDDEKTSRDAARHLIQFRVAVGKRRKPSTKIPKRDTDAMRVAEYVEGLSRGQIDAIIDEFGSNARSDATDQSTSS